ncbi:hypothetical protein EXN66_Car002337 [Channa argus]|uniref:Uncharacterized protein n=1 Tax=Channa argus TaxID=215402 RepID=A0A6G1P8T3_CHAAH|nr:hypothetical protein EXN66_Car002337 [Channa argus]
MPKKQHTVLMKMITIIRVQSHLSLLICKCPLLQFQLVACLTPKLCPFVPCLLCFRLLWNDDEAVVAVLGLFTGICDMYHDSAVKLN